MVIRFSRDRLFHAITRDLIAFKLTDVLADTAHCRIAILSSNALHRNANAQAVATSVRRASNSPRLCSSTVISLRPSNPLTFLYTYPRRFIETLPKWIRAAAGKKSQIYPLNFLTKTVKPGAFLFYIFGIIAFLPTVSVKEKKAFWCPSCVNLGKCK